MNKKIYTYTNIENLLSYKQYEELKNIPHITATIDLKDAISNLYSQEKGTTPPPILSIHLLLRQFIGEWKKPSIQLRQYIKLNEIVRQLLQEANEEDRGILLGFKRNQKEVLSAIRVLVESNIYPDDMEKTNVEEQVFYKIWKRLELEDEAIDRYRNSMYLAYEDKNKVQECIDKAYRKAKGKVGEFNPKKVVLHGFYFITPIQKRLIELMELQGIEIIFLNCFDARLPEVHKIWTENFSVERGYKPVNEWINLSEEKSENFVYGRLFEGEVKLEKKPNITIKEYNSDMEFIETLEEIDKDSIIYTTDKKYTDELVKEVFPERMKDRHLLSYPVGQFLYYLHLMWDDLHGELTLDMEYISHCFASGWVYKDGLQGKNYLYELEKISTYFKGCRCIKDWDCRLNELYDATNNVVSLFDNHLNEVNENTRRWHHLMGNPFINFSVFSEDKERINNVITLIKHLIDTAQKLFGDDSEISLEEHFKKLTRILNENRSEKVELYKEEEKIIEELFKRLKIHDEVLEKCFPGDIAEAMMLFLGGEFNTEENDEMELSEENLEEIDSEDEIVKPLNQVEASRERVIHKNKKKVHLCMCDEQRMPGTVTKYPWPITDNLLDNLKLDNRRKSKELIEDFRFIIRNNPLCNRYLFYRLLQNKEVEISWIGKEKEKKIDPSSYIKLICMQHQIEPDKSKVHKVTKDIINKENSVECISNTLKLDMYSEIPSEVKLEASLCPIRYLYSYILQEYPTYKSEFHYNFMLSRLIASIVSATGKRKEMVGEQVLNLFPYLRKIEKNQVLDYTERLQNVEKQSYDGYRYTDARLRVHFLNGNIVDRARVQYKEQSTEKNYCDIDIREKSKNQEECTFCSHNNYCVNVVFPVDKEKR